MNENPFLISEPAPVCAGTGLVALDVVFNGSSDVAPKLWAGGSCGNVLTILAYFGWQSYPVARLGEDSAADKIQDDMKAFKVNLDFIQADKRSNSPIIIERICNRADGNPTHRFHWICPNCGTWLPRYRPILLNRARRISERLRSLECFYFDRISPGALELAWYARQSGALVVFEPPSDKNRKAFDSAVQVSHIVKYAGDQVCHFEELPSKAYPLLVVETFGADGMRYKFQKTTESTNQWKTLSAYRVEGFRDSAGAGDWCTAGIIQLLGQGGAERLERAGEEEVIEALQFGQAMAALNCRYEGARGGMYILDKTRFEDSVKKLMCCQEISGPVSETFSEKASDIVACICPGCKGASKSLSNTNGHIS